MPQQVAHQVGDCGFAIGAGDADPGHAAAGPKGQLHFPLDADSLLPQPGQGRVVPADAWAHHHASDGGGESDESLGAQGGAKLNLDTQLLQFGCLGFQLGAGLAFDHQHRLAAMAKQLGGPDTGARQANNNGQIGRRDCHLAET